MSGYANVGSTDDESFLSTCKSDKGKMFDKYMVPLVDTQHINEEQVSR